MKTCSKCVLAKPVNEFPTDKTKLSGIRAYCKSCASEMSREYRSRNLVKCKEKGLQSAKKSYAKHSEKRVEYARTYRIRNPGQHCKIAYGITHKDKMELLRLQGNKCGICETSEHKHPCSITDNGWCVDHDHSTGIVRGILCWNCNLALGHAKDSTDVLIKMITYLDRANRSACV